MRTSRASDFGAEPTEGVSRRTVLQRAGASGLVAAGLLARRARVGSAAAQETTPAAAPPVSGPTFVGIADDGLTYAAVVVEEPAFDGAERQLRVYLCDAPRIVEWFTGSTTHTAADLTAEDGSTLTVELGRTEVTGAAKLADGTELTFAAEPVSGIAGLFAATISEEGVVTAESADGKAHLEGWVLREPVDLGGDEAFPVAVAIVPADGAFAAIQVALTGRGASDACGLIVLADRTSKGAGKFKSAEGSSGTSFSWIWPDF